jgi:signal transduction histidine kinase
MLAALDVSSIFHALPGPCLVVSPELIVEAANDAYLVATGTHRDALVGHQLPEAPPDYFAPAGPQWLPSLRASLAQVLATGQPHTMAPHGYEASDLAKAGGVGTRYWRPTNTLVRDAQGQPAYLIHHLLDVTAQVEAEAQLRACQAREQAARAEAEGLRQAQRELQQLNQELASRVAERTQQLEDSLHDAQQQRQQLDEQQQLLRQILSLVPAAVATFSGPEHSLTFFNETYQAMVVKPVALATPAAALFPEEVEKGFLTLLDEVYTTGQPVVGNEVMARYLAASTTPRYLDFTYQALLGPEGQPAGVVASVIDVTEKVLARQQVQQLNEELATLNQELLATNKELHLSNLALGQTNEQLTRTNVDLDNFIYTASHDLKSPISNIDGLLLAVQQELPIEAQVGHVPLMLGMMRDAIERFKRTIGHLTDVSRLQKEHSQAASQVPLAALITEVSLDLTPLLRQTGGQLEVLVPESTTLTFSEKNLRSVVYNLLSNALKYHHPARKPHVRVAYRAKEAYQVLEVQDNGLGLDLSQEQAKLFAMFQRLHTHVEGSGIGLYMVKRMVENVGGHIEVASTLGLGSTFSVYFPY